MIKKDIVNSKVDSKGNHEADAEEDKHKHEDSKSMDLKEKCGYRYTKQFGDGVDENRREIEMQDDDTDKDLVFSNGVVSKAPFDNDGSKSEENDNNCDKIEAAQYSPEGLIRLIEFDLGTLDGKEIITVFSSDWEAI